MKEKGNCLASGETWWHKGSWVPELDRLFVAVPHNGNQGAEIRIYEPELP
ncbi:MAG: hypothetical protein ABSB63_22590 [Spirochaetia bacterium]